MSRYTERMNTTCWYYDVRELCDPARYANAMRALPWGERRERVERFVFQKDRLLCLGAGLLLAHALREAGAKDLALVYGEHKKPRLAREQGVHFNLSHSGTLAMCAVSGEPVGADVEALHAYDAGVMRLAATPAEHEWMSTQDDKDRAFTRLWTRKESYLKLTGAGLSTPPDSVEVAPGSTPEPGVSFVECWVADHHLCVCTRGSHDVAFVRWHAGA